MDINCNIIGGIKIKDGLFIGDQYIFYDKEFLWNNKINYVINTSPSFNKKKFLKLNENKNLNYLKISFINHKLYDFKSNLFLNFIKFIEESLDKCESVLIFSFKDINKIFVLIILLLMYRYNWSFNKAFEFINIKNQFCKVKKDYLNKINEFEKELKIDKDLSNTWNEHFSKDKYILGEEILLSNTYKNLNLQDKKFIKKIKNENNLRSNSIKWKPNKSNINLKNDKYNNKINKIISINRKKTNKTLNSFSKPKINDKTKIIKQEKYKKKWNRFLKVNKNVLNILNTDKDNTLKINKYSNLNSKISTYLSEDSNNKEITKNKKNINIFKKKATNKENIKKSLATNSNLKQFVKNSINELNFSLNNNKNKILKNSVLKEKINFNKNSYKVFNKRPNSAPLNEEETQKLNNNLNFIIKTKINKKL